MAQFPLPPSIDELRAVGPIVKVLVADTELWRVYGRGGSHPVTWGQFRAFGPVGGRFDHQIPPPSVQDREILYTAESGVTCLAEVFQDTRVIDRRLRQPWLVGFRTIDELSLLDTSGVWPTRLGASMALNSGPRDRAEVWSRAIYEAYPDVQGIYYGSSMFANNPALALYERAKVAMPRRPTFNRALADPVMSTTLANVGYLLNFRLV